jgi:hypothetical protein
MNAAPGSLPRQHFLHYFSEEIPIAERGIRTAANTPPLTLVYRDKRRARMRFLNPLYWLQLCAGW